jgi:hypothetical protein
MPLWRQAGLLLRQAELFCRLARLFLGWVADGRTVC